MTDKQILNRDYGIVSKSLLYLVALYFLVGCVGERDEKSKEGDITDIFIALKESQYQLFDVDNSKDTTLFGRFGTRVLVSANSLLHSDGTRPTKPIVIKLIEAYSPGHMIINRLSTITDKGNYLSTDGMIFLSATVDESELRISEDFPLKISFPKSTKFEDTPFQLYEGIETNEGIIWKDEPIGYEILEDLPKFILEDGKDAYMTDSQRHTNDLYMRLFETNRLGWINVDIVLPKDYGTRISLYVESQLSIKQAVFVFFHDLRFMPFFIYLGSKTDGEAVFPSLPISTSADLFAFYHDGNSFYYHFSSMTLSHNSTVELTYNSIAEKDLLHFLENANWID